MIGDESPFEFTTIEDFPGGRGRLVDWAWVRGQWKSARYWTADDVEVIQERIPESARLYAPPAHDRSPYLTVKVGLQPFMWINAGWLEWAQPEDAPADADGGYTAADGRRRMNLSRHQEAGQRTSKQELDYGPLCPTCFLEHRGDCDL